MKMLNDSWPLILSGLMVTIYMKIDQVMLGNMADTQAVGNYAAAVKFSEVWYFVPTAICASVFPTIIRAKQKGKQQYREKLQQLYDLMTWISIPLAVVMTFFSGTLTSKLLGAGYTEAGKILAWHILASPFVFLGVARQSMVNDRKSDPIEFCYQLLRCDRQFTAKFLADSNLWGQRCSNSDCNLLCHCLLFNLYDLP